MEIGVVSDVHGNLVALEAVLADMPDVEQLVCCGDVVGYNPWHADCLDEIREREVPTVQGNHDRAVASGHAPGFNRMARAAVDYAREQLDADRLAWLANLPQERTVLDGRVKLVHGHPDDPDHYTRRPEFGPNLLADEDVLLLGHTHVQHHRIFDEGIVCNPGSVGQPRDGDPRAAYATIDLDEMTVEEHRVEYDIDAVVAAIEDAGLPERLGSRLREGQ